MKSNENSTNTQQLQLSQLTTILLLGTVLLLFSSFEKNVFNTTTLSTLFLILSLISPLQFSVILKGLFLKFEMMMMKKTKLLFSFENTEQQINGD